MDDLFRSSTSVDVDSHDQVLPGLALLFQYMCANAITGNY